MNKPTNWKEVARVLYSNKRIFAAPYITAASEPAFTSGTRGTAIIPTDHTVSVDTLTISNYRYAANYIDRADLAQFDMFQAAEAGKLQGSIVSEGIEAAMLADHAAWTDFGDTGGGVLGLAATQITVSSTNIDDLIRAIKRTVYVANGVELAIENGFFSIWRPADFELLEGFVQSSGFTEADVALKNGVPPGLGFKYLGMEHYLSNDHAANHLFAGVKKMQDLGILRSTYGRAKFIEDPAKLSGLGVVSRVDYGFQTSVPNKTLIFDVNVV